MGGLAFLVACLPFTLAFDSAPIPPTPFPAGRGRFLVFLCKGLCPLHPRGWVGCGTGFACGKRDTAGGLLSLPPAAPAFSLLCYPHPPRPPSPEGKGETKVISCKGLRPLHPRGWVGCGTGFACGKRFTARACPGGTGAWWALMRPAGGACILCRLPTPPCRYPEGACLLGRLPTLPGAFSFFHPHFPAGR